MNKSMNHCISQSTIDVLFLAANLSQSKDVGLMLCFYLAA
jgi:hypothetical protein